MPLAAGTWGGLQVKEQVAEHGRSLAAQLLHTERAILAFGMQSAQGWGSGGTGCTFVLLMLLRLRAASCKSDPHGTGPKAAHPPMGCRCAAPASRCGRASPAPLPAGCDGPAPAVLAAGAAAAAGGGLHVLAAAPLAVLCMAGSMADVQALLEVSRRPSQHAPLLHVLRNLQPFFQSIFAGQGAERLWAARAGGAAPGWHARWASSPRGRCPQRQRSPCHRRPLAAAAHAAGAARRHGAWRGSSRAARPERDAVGRHATGDAGVDEDCWTPCKRMEHVCKQIRGATTA